MTDFLNIEKELYVLFLYGFSYVFIGISILFFLLKRVLKYNNKWIWLSSWAFFYGFHEIFGIIYINFPFSIVDYLDSSFKVFSIFSLSLFVSGNFDIFAKRKYLKKIIIFSLLIIFFLNSVFDFLFLKTIISFLVGLLAIFVALYFFRKFRLKDEAPRIKILFFIISFLFLGFALTSMIEIDFFVSTFSSLSYELILRLVRAIMGFLLGGVILLIAVEFNATYFLPKYYFISRRFIIGSLFVFLLIFLSGYSYLSLKKDIYIDNSKVYMKEGLITLANQHEKYGQIILAVADTIVDHPEASLVFSAKTASSTESLKKLVSSFKEKFGFSVIYFLNKEGVVVMATNSEDDDSFLGKNYSFRPYFINALNGDDSVYFAEGVTSGKRGLYYSVPVYNNNSKDVVGVLVIKNTEDDFVHYYIDRPGSVLLSPNGVVFLSPDKEIENWSLFDLSEQEKSEIIAKKQFGENEIKSLGLQRVAGNIYSSHSGSFYFLGRMVISKDGWSIGYLEKISPLKNILASSILDIFVVFLLLVALFFFILNYLIDSLILQVTEYKYKDVFHKSRDLIQNISPEGKIIFVNPAWKERMGYSDTEISNLNIKDIIFEKDYKAWLEKIKYISTGKSLDYLEIRVITKNKEVLWVTGNITPHMVNNKLYAARGFFRDVTEEKKRKIESEETNIKLEKLLKEAKNDKVRQETQRLATLNILEDVSATQEELATYNKNLEKKSEELESLAMLSGEFASVFEVEKLILKVKNYLLKNTNAEAITFFIKLDDSRDKVFYSSFLKKSFAKSEIRNLNEKTLEYIIQRSELFALKTSDIEALKNKVVGKVSKKVSSKIESELFLDLIIGKKHLGFIYFSSKEKKAYSENIISYLKTIAASFSVALANAQTLSKTQQSKTESLVRTLSNGILMFDNSANLLLINPAAEKFCGISRANKSLEDFYKKMHEYKIKESLLTALNKGAVTEIKEMTSKDDGVEYIYQVLITPIYDFNNKIIGAAIVMQDITHIKYIDKMKTEFVSVASHQLRTPLTAIKLFTEMLINEHVGKITKEQKEYLSNVYDSTERMVGLVNDLLNVTRIESGRLMINPESTDLDKFILSLLSEAKPLAEIKNVKITYKPKKGLPPIPLDRGLIRQVYHNLLTNAIRYSRTGGKVSVAIKSDSNNFVVSVTDSGIGIPKEAQARIFEKFFRADNAVKIATEGTGLGLYVSRMIIESSGGSLWFESKVNKGTTFFVSLPKKGMIKKKGERGLSIS